MDELGRWTSIALLLGASACVAAEPPPTDIVAEGAALPEGPVHLSLALDDVAVSFGTDRGPAPANLRGHVQLDAVAGRRAEGPAEVAGGVLYLDSIATGRGDTGAITIAIEPGTGSSRFDHGAIEVHATARAALSYDLLDATIGARLVDDYAESPAEGAAAVFDLAGTFDRKTGAYAVSARIELQVTEPLLGALASAVATADSAPLAPAQDASKKEICVQVTYLNEAARRAWAPDVDAMIDEANRIWCERCNIKIRTRLIGDRDCATLQLRESYTEGGGGTCHGGGRVNDSSVIIGHNVVEACRDAGTATTFGRVLAHELGHSFGLPQSVGSGDLMDNCAPSDRIPAADCRRACGRSRALPTAPSGNEAKEERISVTNNVGRLTNDLHIESDVNLWVTNAGGFKDWRGNGTRQLDFGRGGVAELVYLDLVGFQRPKRLTCYWTIDGVAVRAPEREDGGCTIATR